MRVLLSRLLQRADRGLPSVPVRAAAPACPVAVLYLCPPAARRRGPTDVLRAAMQQRRARPRRASPLVGASSCWPTGPVVRWRRCSCSSIVEAGVDTADDRRRRRQHGRALLQPGARRYSAATREENVGAASPSARRQAKCIAGRLRPAKASHQLQRPAASWRAALSRLPGASVRVRIGHREQPVASNIAWRRAYRVVAQGSRSMGEAGVCLWQHGGERAGGIRK